MFDRDLASALIACLNSIFEKFADAFSLPSDFPRTCERSLRHVVSSIRDGDAMEEIEWRGSEASAWMFPTDRFQVGEVVMRFEPPFEA